MQLEACRGFFPLSSIIYDTHTHAYSRKKKEQCMQLEACRVRKADWVRKLGHDCVRSDATA